MPPDFSSSPNAGLRVWNLLFPEGRRARAVQLEGPVPSHQVLAALELPPFPAVLLLHGGAGGMAGEQLTALESWIAHALVPWVARHGLLVLDGGTQAGVMRLMGEALARTGTAIPLVGVCPARRVTWPGGPQDPDRVPLEPHHTHFVLTPGTRWGEETPYLFALAEEVSRTAPSVALLVNGGKVSLEEVRWNIRQGRPIVVVRGSGRLADRLAMAREQRAVSDPDLPPEVRAYPGYHWVHLSQEPQTLVHTLANLLGLPVEHSPSPGGET